MEDFSFADRAENFINNEIAELDALHSSTDGAVDRFTTIREQYKEIIRDLISVRQKYISLLKKYDSNFKDYAAPTFPGVQSSLPAYSNVEMVQDSTDMEDMAASFEQLQEQKDILEGQLRNALKDVVSLANQTIQSSSQISVHFEQFLIHLESPYSAGDVSSSDI